MDPVIAVLTKRVSELDKDIHRLRTGIDYHQRKQWELEVEVESKDRELDQLYAHLVELKAKESA
ncbi:hypothetical protein SEA_POCAHONTAS_42 [Mycobacterium phage Pocahontas]|nr:hypothetical protein SEA_POPCICLE_42 [Mycobacterium phage Popcicle]QDP44908.1 hypothetical protein SEA_POCAHONTAS_42 [Mycobacterium phage Pocahontas]